MPAETDDLDLKMAMAVGLGMTVEEAADFAGLSRASFYNRSAQHPEFYDTVRTIAEVAAEKTVAYRIAALKSAQTAEEKIISRLDAALKITDKIIAQLGDDDNVGRCEECGRIKADTIQELIKAHTAVTQWVAKFAASEKPKLFSVSGAVMHGHVQLLDASVDAMTALESHFRAHALIPESTDIQVTATEVVP